ncbi:MAG: hypothetical protein D6732_17805 [Methanobacteriota archaeon]|nr:MAG: hypothetical protein D6732_17805 [Euryarchaeota archaeon]
MRKDRIFAIVWKDLKDLMQSKYVVISLFTMPLLFGVFIPILSLFPFLGIEDTNSQTEEFSFLPPLTDNWDQLTELQQGLIFTIETMNFMFLLLPIILPTVLAADSFVGEKDRKTVINLLVAPISDLEIYLGKILSTIIPTLVAIFIAGIIYTVSTTYVTLEVLGFPYLLNPRFFVLIIVITPLLIVATTNLMIWVSTRTATTRDAQQLGSTISLISVPFIAIAMFTLYFSPLYFFAVVLILVLVDYLSIKLGINLMNREKLYFSY